MSVIASAEDEIKNPGRQDDGMGKLVRVSVFSRPGWQSNGRKVYGRAVCSRETRFVISPLHIAGEKRELQRIAPVTWIIFHSHEIALVAYCFTIAYLGRDKLCREKALKQSAFKPAGKAILATDTCLDRHQREANVIYILCPSAFSYTAWPQACCFYYELVCSTSTRRSRRHLEPAFTRCLNFNFNFQCHLRSTPRQSEP
ncbi:lysozyme [Anopheles sinensis]|uniref:Lysozyme n=1 Tax=Anopheles sinensis TaxID=74873 RepID=A0A084WGG2_ANOSI|nr:lysozyme [Anopheles sinensis]